MAETYDPAKGALPRAIVPKTRVCPTCDGKKWELWVPFQGHDPEHCHLCKGTGVIPMEGGS